MANTQTWTTVTSARWRGWYLIAGALLTACGGEGVADPDLDVEQASSALIDAADDLPTALNLEALCTAPRPRSNTGKGFYVVKDKIYDANGVEFRIRGVNHTHWWGGTGEEAIPYIRKAHANTSRAVFGPGLGADTTALRKSIVQKYIANRVVPMVEWHKPTCDESPESLRAAVDLWVGPDKDWLKKYERYVIINIANEWGPNSTLWRDEYKLAVQRLRAAGVKNLLVIDAGGDCGQNADSIETWGKEIFAADPEKNVAFSIHMYGYWHNPGSPDVGSWDGRQPYDIDKELTKLTATGLPILVGEFSSDADETVGYTTRLALSSYEQHRVGWLAWMWDNPDGDLPVDIVSANVYNSSADLTAYGKLIVEDPQLGLKARARRATIF
jgi:mannan endo-1,4-beta-mannosidase